MNAKARVVTLHGNVYAGDDVAEARRVFERVTGVQIARLPKDVRKAKLRAMLIIDGNIVTST